MKKKKSCLCCFENGRSYCGGQECRAYAKQVTWNRKIARLAKDAGVSVRKVPAPPDYSTAKQVTRRIAEVAVGYSPVSGRREHIRTTFYLELLRLAGRI